jgi:hypothetical protein
MQFELVTVEEKQKRMKTVMKDFLTKHPSMKLLVYTNFASNAISKLCSTCYEVLEDVTKVQIMDQFTAGLETGLEGDTKIFPCQILVLTDAGKCGISSFHLGLVIQDKIPPSLLHWSQESGRLGSALLLSHFCTPFGRIGTYQAYLRWK